MELIEELSAELARTGRLTLNIKVTPKSSKTAIVGMLPDGTLRINVAAAPEKGKANAELCAFLGKQFGMPRSRVAVESGHTSRYKRVSVRFA